ncbi:MAG: FG-GAP-like repeat-containing protein, partial [Planctomycetota bacterium]
AADLDGDGDLDLLGAAPDEPVTWWENLTGDGGEWLRHPIGQPKRPVGLTT